MQNEKIPFTVLLNKMIVTKEGKRLGYIRNITFESSSGELISLVLKDATPYAQNLNLEKTGPNEVLVPYNTILAIGDFVIISEEDLI